LSLAVWVASVDDRRGLAEKITNDFYLDDAAFPRLHFPSGRYDRDNAPIAPRWIIVVRVIKFEKVSKAPSYNIRAAGDIAIVFGADAQRFGNGSAEGWLFRNVKSHDYSLQSVELLKINRSITSYRAFGLAWLEMALHDDGKDAEQKHGGRTTNKWD